MAPCRIIPSGDAGEQGLLDEPADDVTGRDMDLLDEWCGIRRGMQAQIAQCGHLPAGSSGKPYHSEAFLAGGANRPQDVRRTSGRRDHDQDVAGTAETEDLPFEYPVVAIIVADCGQHRAVGRQCDGGARRTIIVESRQHLAGQVLRIAGAAAVARQKKLAAAAQRTRGNLGDVPNHTSKGRIVDRRLNGIARLDQVVDDRVH